MVLGRGEDTRAAFAAVFDAERDAVVRLAFVLVGDRELASELAADAFAATYERWRRGRVDNPAGYVRQVVVNRARDHFRRVDRRRRFEARRHGDDRGVMPMDDGVASRELVQVLLRDLPARQRAAVVPRYWADFTDGQIAEALDVPLGTAKSLLRRGMTGLRAQAPAPLDQLQPRPGAEPLDRTGDGT